MLKCSFISVHIERFFQDCEFLLLDNSNILIKLAKLHCSTLYTCEEIYVCVCVCGAWHPREKLYENPAIGKYIRQLVFFYFSIFLQLTDIVIKKNSR